MENKVILYLTPNKNIRDGTTHCVQEIVNRIKSNFRFEGHCLLSVSEDKKTLEKHFLKLLPGIKTHLIRTLLPKRIMKSYLGEYLVSPYLKSADIHLFFTNFIPYLLPKGKIAVVIHDLTPMFEKQYSDRKRKTMRKRYRFACKRSDLIFTDCEYTKNKILENFPEAKGKIKVVYMGVDAESYSELITKDKKDFLKKKYGISENYILFVGQPRTNKNIEGLIRGYSNLDKQLRSKHRLLIANSNHEIKTLVESLGLSNCVHLLNGIDQDDMVSIYKMAATVALVSFEEGFGLPIVEGMAAGVPVITSNISCMPEIAGGAALLINPDNIQDIAAGLNEILSNDQKRAKCIEMGKHNVGRFSWDNAAESYKNELLKLIN